MNQNVQVGNNQMCNQNNQFGNNLMGNQNMQFGNNNIQNNNQQFGPNLIIIKIQISIKILKIIMELIQTIYLLKIIKIEIKIDFLKKFKISLMETNLII